MDDFRFKKDAHWNERGNLLAAIHLYRILEQNFELSRIPEDSLARLLYTYYSAFPDYRWIPDAWIKRTDNSPEELLRIKSKYLALDLEKDHIQ